MAEKKHPSLRIAFYFLRFFFRAIPLPERLRESARDWVILKFGHRLRHIVDRAHIEAGNSSRQPRNRADEAAIGHIARYQTPLPDQLPARLVAFFSVPSEDPLLKTAGTSLWHRIAGALPQFEGHHQPRLPGELGFYDPCNPDLLRQQAMLATEYGVEAFCFRVDCSADNAETDTFLQQWIADVDISISFCFCLQQTSTRAPFTNATGSTAHSPDPDAALLSRMSSLVSHLSHPRSLRIHGKPVLLVDTPLCHASMAQAIRQKCLDSNIGPIHLIIAVTTSGFDPTQSGFDAAIALPWRSADNDDALLARQHLINPSFNGQVNDWRNLGRNVSDTKPASLSSHPVISTGYDTEPLYPGSGSVLLHASPRKYCQWLGEIMHRQFSCVPAEQRLVFIDAWNDWEHGAILEADTRLGYAWLESTRRALRQEVLSRLASTRPCAVIHAWYPDVFAELLQNLKDSGLDWRIVVTTPHQRADIIKEIVQQSGLTAEITCWPNHGRDILPFLHVADRLLDEGEDTIILKLHTKRSPHLKNGEQWRQALVSSLMDVNRARRIFDAFQTNPRLGLVGPEGHILNLIQDMGANERNVSGLLRRSGYLKDICHDDTFIAGSMYWLRLSALQPLLDSHLSPSLFEKEAGQVDGTLAHAVERCIGLLARQAGFEQTDAASLLGESPTNAGLTLHAHRLR